MHRFFIVLMIALLPLRSWAGDVMTLEMAVGQLTGTVHAATQEVPDCHGQNSMHSGIGFETSNAIDATKSNVDSTSDGRCVTCGTCQLCHSVALVDFSFSDLTSLALPSLLSSDSTGFTSAPSALSFKPPIS